MSFCLEIKADYALFTRPEYKVERVSYDIPTPSALRAVFDAILWKPAIKWQIDKIEVLAPIKWLSFRRNEVSGLVPVNKISAARRGEDISKYIENNRQQRAGMMLKDVRYRVHAHFVMTRQAGDRDSPEKFVEMFKRRARKGQCIYQPYLGTRECSCAFRLIENPEEEAVKDPPIALTKDLGYMLYDMHYSNEGRVADGPMFFRAKLENGVLNVPDRNSSEVLA